MVTKLIGNVDGQEIIFRQVEEGLWHSTIPFDLNGTYVVDLIAEDDAGNKVYYATVLFTIDPERLHVSIVFLDYRLTDNLRLHCRLESMNRNFILDRIGKLIFQKQISDYNLVPCFSRYKIERGHKCELH